MEETNGFRWHRSAIWDTVFYLHDDINSDVFSMVDTAQLEAGVTVKTINLYPNTPMKNEFQCFIWAENALNSLDTLQAFEIPKRSIFQNFTIISFIGGGGINSLPIKKIDIQQFLERHYGRVSNDGKH